MLFKKRKHILKFHLEEGLECRKPAFWTPAGSCWGLSDGGLGEGAELVSLSYIFEIGELLLFLITFTITSPVSLSV